MLYPSEEYAYEWFDLRKGIPFDGRITLFAALEDTREPGVFIGTDRSCGVMMGRGPGEFTYTPKVSYGAIEGSMVMVDGSLYADDSARARMLPMWLTPYGICSGVPGMEIRNLTRTTYSFPVGGRGAGLFIPGPNRLILSSVF